MTFIRLGINNDDWYYTGSSSTDNTRWQSEKTIYDPCPAGWRVPDGGSNGVWSKALGYSLETTSKYDTANEGMNFSGNFGSASTIWYPASGNHHNFDGSLSDVGFNGRYWSASPAYTSAYSMYFDYDGNVFPSFSIDRACGYGVRCVQE
jgi:uncharacterized protein (TIGR02145 family)